MQFQDLTMADVMLELHDGPHATPPPAEDGPVYLGIKNLTETGALDLTNIRHIAKGDFPRWTKRVTPQPGDLVFTYEATLHRYALIPQGFNGCLGRRLALVRPNPAVVDPKFLLLAMLGPEWRQTVEAQIITGATVDRIPLIDFPSFRIRLPPLPIQRRIAHFLSVFDELIEINARRIELLTDLARSLYAEWFGRLRFPGHREMKLASSVSGLIPDTWAIRRIGDIASSVRGRSYRRENLVESGGRPFLNLKCVERGGGFRRTGLKRYRGRYKDSQRVKPGDVLVAITDMTQERRIVAQAFRMPDLGEDFAVPSLDLVLLKPDDAMTRAYLYAVLRYSGFSEQLREFANGANVLHLAVERILEHEIVVPSRRVLRAFATALDPILEESEFLQTQSICFAATRDLLLPRLVTGQLDISEVDLGTLKPVETA